jgi:hypothetical protein
MFHSTTLMAAIHADRQREIERVGRDRQLLFQPSDGADARPQAGLTGAATPSVAGLTTGSPAGRARSNGSACEAA